MKFIIFFIFVPLAYSELHIFMTTYTEISGKMIAGIPEFSAVTSLDEQQIDYYDSNTRKLIPRQHWMKEFASKEEWKEYIEISEKQQQVYKNNIHILMERLSQSPGVHTYQRMHGCDWDDESGESHGFDQLCYDGQDFLSLDLKKLRYIVPEEQAIPTVEKWNNDTEQLKSLKQYYDYECVYWLKEFLHLYEATKKTESPKVFLLQKKEEYYVDCHVTGFLFRDTATSWRKNGQPMSNSSKSENGDTLPNEDGTFQRTLTLYVHADEWKRDEYACVVEHKTFAEPIQKILTVNEIQRNKPASDVSYIMYPVLLVIILVIVLCAIWNLLKACCKV